MRLALALTAAALTSCSSAPAFADRVSILLGSEHGSDVYDFNEQNLGIMYTFEDVAWDFDLTVGAYKNSYHNTSVIATASYDLLEWDSGALGVFGGLAHYPETGQNRDTHVGSGWIGIGGLQMRHGNVFGQYIPGVAKASDYIFAFGITFDLESSK